MFTKLTGVKRELKEEREQLESNIENLTYVNQVLVGVRQKALEAARTCRDKVLVLRWAGNDMNPAMLSINKRLIYEACIYEGFSVTLEPEFKQSGRVEFV